MVGVDVDKLFSPLVQHELGIENTIIVKDAKGAQPIRRWLKNWRTARKKVRYTSSS